MLNRVSTGRGSRGGSRWSPGVSGSGGGLGGGGGRPGMISTNARQIKQSFGPGSMHEPLGTGKMPYHWNQQGGHGSSGPAGTGSRRTGTRGTYSWEDGSTTYGAEASKPWWKFGGYDVGFPKR